MSGAAVVAMVVVLAACVMLWTPVASRMDGQPWWFVGAGLPALLGAAALLASQADGVTGSGADVVVAAGVAIAVLGGGPVATAVLRAAEQEVAREGAARSPQAGDARADPARLVEPDGGLRGGMWIGVLERAAVAVSLLIGQPGGIAVVVAIKGLGRYLELRAPGASERFIIGTLASLLWAAAAAGLTVLLT